MQRTVTLCFAAVVLVATTGCTPRDTAVSACLDRALLVLPPTHSTATWPGPTVIPNGSTIDARATAFEDSIANDTGHRASVKIAVYDDQEEDLCLVGGVAYTDPAVLHPELTPWDTWHLANAVTVEKPDFHLVGTRLYNHGDGVAFAYDAARWRVTGVRVDGPGGVGSGYIHDDCIENDTMHEGKVHDSKFDGCMVFMSSRAGQASTLDGSGNTVEIVGTLVRLRPFLNSFDPERFGYGNTGGFFKWGNGVGSYGAPPRLVIRRSIFRADQPAAYGGNINGGLGLPPGTVCEDVALVGTETWPDSDLESWTDQCTGLQLASADLWDQAVEVWNEAHPAL
jgi:hypothetical protein